MIRAYEPGDAEALIALYRDSVEGLGPRAYDAAQIAAWAAYPEDTEAFRTLLAEGLTLIGVENELPVAFGQLNPWNRIAFLYTRTGHERRGHAARLYRQLESDGEKTKLLRDELGLRTDGPIHVIMLFLESVRAYRLEEVSNGLEWAGLRLEETFGDFEGAEFDSHSDRLILVGRRPE